MSRRSSILITILAVLAPLAASSAQTPAPDFSRDVRPILARHCFKCHGPDDASRKAKLRLDVRASAVAPSASDAIAIVPGKPAESEVVRRLTTSDDDERMPPPSTKSSLTADERDTITRWIAAGAEYRPHWAFMPPQRVAAPDVRNTAWPK